MGDHCIGQCRRKALCIGLPLEIVQHPLIQLGTDTHMVIQSAEKTPQIRNGGIVLPSLSNGLCVHHFPLKDRVRIPVSGDVGIDLLHPKQIDHHVGRCIVALRNHQAEHGVQGQLRTIRIS